MACSPSSQGEPELARLVGEAVLAILDAGESLGPPLVIPLESVLGPPDDPREVLDYSYQRQLEAMQKIRRGVADVATSRKRVELQTGQLEQTAAGLARQRQDALDAGHQDLASEAQARAASAREQLSDLRQQHSTLLGEEQELAAASQRLQAKVDAFRIRKEMINATYTAGEASRVIRDALTDIGEDVGDLEVTIAAAGTSAGSDTGPAVAGDAPGPADQAGALPPPGMMELRPGAPDSARVRLLFVAEPQDTVILVARIEDPGRSPDQYQEVVPVALGRLAMAQSGGPPDAAASPAVFLSYDSESFLDEFFPGAETEVEIGAAALVARHRAHTLSQARQRMRLTQVQVARRMNVRQERVSAIERAEPGATEVRTLAAYVGALGGRLEIIADIGGERITLR